MTTNHHHHHPHDKKRERRFSVVIVILISLAVSLLLLLTVFFFFFFSKEPALLSSFSLYRNSIFQTQNNASSSSDDASLVLGNATDNTNITNNTTKGEKDDEVRENEKESDPFAQNESFAHPSFESHSQIPNKDDDDDDDEDVLLAESLRGCDLYNGKWVRDDDNDNNNNNNTIVYEAGSCPYVDEAFDCQSNGRPDSLYLLWRWKPSSCQLPRFNATDFLVRLRGKRLMLVGDSMNRNQFESILCLLRQGLSNKSRMYEIHGYKITKGRGYYVFKFEDYNCTVEFVRSHFLVKEGVRINGQGNTNPTLSIDQIDKTSNRWKQADILVFNTGHWWTHGKTARGKNYYKEGDYIYPKFDAVEAYRRALKTWAKWIDENIDPRKQLVFYRGYSSAHFRGGDWDSGGTCNGESQPILSGAFLDNYPLKMKIVEEVIQDMRVPVTLLNVTRLTNFRKDGHPSIYGKSTSVKKSRRQDCSHWCLPGVPDAWNELIYANLIIQHATLKSYKM